MKIKGRLHRDVYIKVSVGALRGYLEANTITGMLKVHNGRIHAWQANNMVTCMNRWRWRVRDARTTMQGRRRGGRG